MTDLWIIYKSLNKIFTMAVSQWMTELYGQFIERGIQEGSYLSITQQDMQALTGISSDRQTYIIKKLVAANFIKIRKRGIPAQNYYQINFNLVRQAVNDFKKSQVVLGKNQNLSSDKNQEQVLGKSKDKFLENPRTNNININNNIFSSNISLSNDKDLFQRENGALATPPPTIDKVSNAEIREILDYWKNLRINGEKLPQFRMNSKSTKEAMKVIRKVLEGHHEVIPKLTSKKIKELFYNHALEALHDDYSPKGKSKERLRKIAVGQFFWNSFAADNSPNRSRCLRLLEAEPEKCNMSGVSLKPINDMASMTTNRLKKVWQDKEGKFKETKVNINKFIRAGNMLCKFHLDWRIPDLLPPYELAEYLIDAVKKYFNGNISIGNLCSQYTFEKILPDYLREIGEID